MGDARMTVQDIVALVAAVVAVIAAAAAWLATRRAWEANRIAAFDRRKAVHDEVREQLSEILRNGKADFDQTFALARAYQDSLFLFPEPVCDQLKAIHGRAVAYARAHIKSNALDGDMNENIRRENELHKALIADLSGLPFVFLDCTALREWTGRQALSLMKQQASGMTEWLNSALAGRSAEDVPRTKR